MNNFQKYGIAAFTVLIIGLGAATTFAVAKKSSPAPAAASAKAADANTIIDKGWSVRCPPKTKGIDKKVCEVFSLLQVKSSGMRVAEFAVGFPQDKTLPAGTARGVIILPLGILLQPGTSSMAVDAGTPFGFSSRFCTTAGCVSTVNLGQNILDALKKGKALNIFFKTSNNQDVHMVIGLSSFKKAFSNIE